MEPCNRTELPRLGHARALRRRGPRRARPGEQHRHESQRVDDGHDAEELEVGRVAGRQDELPAARRQVVGDHAERHHLSTGLGGASFVELALGGHDHPGHDGGEGLAEEQRAALDAERGHVGSTVVDRCRRREMPEPTEPKEPTEAEPW